MSSIVPNETTMPDFDDLADIFWRLGVMQSPAQLHGYLAGQLAVGDELAAEQWLRQAATYIDAVQPPDTEDNRILLALYTATSCQLRDGDLDLQLLLPDDAVDIGQRIDAVSQWCQGFLAGFAMAGKVVQQQQGQQHYSQEVSEMLSDMAAISQVSLGEEDDDQEQRENNIFELSEYLRLAAITLYLECHKSTTVGESVTESDQEAATLGSPGALFNKSNKPLH